MRGPLGAVWLALLITIPAGTAYWLTLGCGGSNEASHGGSAAAYGGRTPISLINDLGAPVCTVQMGPSSAGEWGDNWLEEGEAIQPGADRTFSTRGDAEWDVRVFGCPLASGGQLAVAMRIPMGASSRISLRAMTPGGSSGGRPSGSSGGSVLPSSH